MVRFFFVLSLVVAFCHVEVFSSETKYDFVGSHFLASYYQCNSEILNDPAAIAELFKEGIGKSGATLLKIADYQFEPYGVTLVALLSESHASIHTYPEQGACFVDFFTCGTSCDHTNFHQVLQQGLESKSCCHQFIHRN